VRVLIADDHALFRDGLRSLLESRGVDVIGEVRNGREAVDQARRLGPDVVLMDLHMPELDGLAATRLTAQRTTAPSIHPGTGIGLALCKKIVERHHGQIRIESEPGRGTTCSVTLPIAPLRKEQG
jgi:CheY-like chemotaxis protein